MSKQTKSYLQTESKIQLLVCNDVISSMINRVYSLIYAEERGEIGFGFFRHPVYCFRVFVNPGKTLALAYYIYIFLIRQSISF